MPKSPRKHTTAERRLSVADAPTSEPTPPVALPTLPFEILEEIGEHVHLLDTETAELAEAGYNMVSEGSEALIEEEVAFERQRFGPDAVLSPWLQGMLAFADTGGETNIRKTAAKMRPTAPKMRLVSKQFDSIMKPIIFRRRSLPASAHGIKAKIDHHLGYVRELTVSAFTQTLGQRGREGTAPREVQSHYDLLASALSKIPLQLVSKATVVALAVVPGRPTRLGTRALMAKPAADLVTNSLHGAQALTELSLYGLSEMAIVDLLGSLPRLRTLAILGPALEPILADDMLEHLAGGTRLQSALASLINLRELFLGSDELPFLWLSSTSVFESLSLRKVTLNGSVAMTDQIVFAAKAFGSTLVDLRIRCNGLQIVGEGLATPEVEQALKLLPKLKTLHISIGGSWTADLTLFFSFPTFPSSVESVRIDRRTYDLQTTPRMWDEMVGLVPQLAEKGVRRLKIGAAIAVSPQRRAAMRQACLQKGIECRMT